MLTNKEAKVARDERAHPKFTATPRCGIDSGLEWYCKLAYTLAVAPRYHATSYNRQWGTLKEEDFLLRDCEDIFNLTRATKRARTAAGGPQLLVTAGQASIPIRVSRQSYISTLVRSPLAWFFLSSRGVFTSGQRRS